VKTPSSSESIYLNWLICREISLRHVDGLREPKSHAVHNPHTIDPEKRSILTGGRSGKREEGCRGIDDGFGRGG